MVKFRCVGPDKALPKGCAVTLPQALDQQERQTIRRWENPSWWNLFIVLPWALAAVLSIHEWRVDRDVATATDLSLPKTRY